MEHPILKLISDNPFLNTIFAGVIVLLLDYLIRGGRSFTVLLFCGLSQRLRGPEELLAAIRQHYYFLPPSVARLNAYEALYQKLLFYGGRNLERRHRLTLWEAVPLNFHIKRDAAADVEEIIDQRRPFTFLHINIFGPQRQGKSVLLAALAQELMKKNPGLVLYCHSCAAGAMNTKNIMLYNRVCYRKAWRRLGPLPPLIVIIDDIFDTPGIDAAVARTFVEELSALCASRSFAVLPLVLVTSSLEEIASSHDVAISLQISPQEEERLLHKIARDPPVLVEDGPLSVQDLWGALGGYRHYGNHFGAFLSSIVHRSPPCAFTLSVTSLTSDLSPPMCANLELVAACQLVDVAVPIHILEKQVLGVKAEALVDESQGYVGSKLDEGLHLHAPHFAWVLLRNLGATNSDAIAALFRILFQAVISERKHQWTRMESEFLRHLVYRLAMQRYSALGPDVNGPFIARSLVEEFWPSIWAHVRSNRDVPRLAAWAATMVRVNLIEHAARICGWINDVCSQPIEDIECFVRFLTALNRLPHQTYADIKAGALPYLDLEAVLKRDKSPLRRRNEAVHTYIRFLSNIDPGKAYRMLSFAENAVPFDAITTLTKAKLLSKKNDPHALAAFSEAVSLAQTEVRASPSVLVECLWQHAVHTPVNECTEASVAEDFDRVFEYLKKWRLGWRFNKAGRVLRDYVSFLCKCHDGALTDRLSRLDEMLLEICRLHRSDDDMPGQVPYLVKQVTDVLIIKNSAVYRVPASNRFSYATDFLCYYLRQVPCDDLIARQLLRLLRLSAKVADHEERLTLARDLFSDILPKNKSLAPLVRLSPLAALVDAS